MSMLNLQNQREKPSKDPFADVHNSLTADQFKQSLFENIKPKKLLNFICEPFEQPKDTRSVSTPLRTQQKPILRILQSLQAAKPEQTAKVDLEGRNFMDWDVCSSDFPGVWWQEMLRGIYLYLERFLQCVCIIVQAEYRTSYRIHVQKGGARVWFLWSFSHCEIMNVNANFAWNSNFWIHTCSKMIGNWMHNNHAKNHTTNWFLTLTWGREIILTHFPEYHNAAYAWILPSLENATMLATKLWVV